MDVAQFTGSALSASAFTSSRVYPVPSGPLGHGSSSSYCNESIKAPDWSNKRTWSLPPAKPNPISPIGVTELTTLSNCALSCATTRYEFAAMVVPDSNINSCSSSSSFSTHPSIFTELAPGLYNSTQSPGSLSSAPLYIISFITISLPAPLATSNTALTELPGSIWMDDSVLLLAPVHCLNWYPFWGIAVTSTGIFPKYFPLHGYVSGFNLFTLICPASTFDTFTVSSVNSSSPNLFLKWFSTYCGRYLAKYFNVTRSPSHVSSLAPHLFIWLGISSAIFEDRESINFATLYGSKFVLSRSAILFTNFCTKISLVTILRRIKVDQDGFGQLGPLGSSANSSVLWSVCPP